MNELQLFNGYMECHPNRMTMEQVVEIIRNDEKLCYRTRQHRIVLKQSGNPKASSHTLPYEGMYAQALHLWRKGFPYWFDGEENDRLNRHNNRFEVPDLLYDLIRTHYRVPIPGEPAVFLTTADIVAHISYALKTPPALHHIGRIMKEAGYTAVRHAGRRGYLVIRLDSEHIEAARRMLGRGN